MPLREYAGAAPATRLSGALASGTTTSFSVITSGGAGYPSGASAPFVVVIDRGTATEEKILVATRSGDVFNTLTRGYDGTSAQAHSAQAIVEHVMDAASLTETNAHVNTPARDDHTQYLNTARHDTPTRHGVGNLPTGTTSATVALGNHTHPTTVQMASFSQPGTLLVLVGKSRFRFPAASTIVDVTMAVNTAPTGAAIICDIDTNGTTIFTTQANRPTIAAGANATAAAAIPDVTAYAAGDYITVDIDQVGSSVAGADLSVFIRYTTP